MARPSADQARLIECLEGVAALLVTMDALADELGIRLTVVSNHAAGMSALQRALEPTNDRMSELFEMLNQVRELVNEALFLFQKQRTERDKGGQEDFG